MVSHACSYSSFSSYHHRIHRDIKFENILFEDDSPHAGVKLIDFGLSKPLLEHEVLNEGAGTMYVKKYCEQLLCTISIGSCLLMFCDFWFHLFVVSLATPWHRKCFEESTRNRLM